MKKILGKLKLINNPETENGFKRSMKFNDLRPFYRSYAEKDVNSMYESRKLL